MPRVTLTPFLLHARLCSVCRAHIKAPCAVGFRLFNDCAYIIARTPDPRRAKA